MVEARDDGTPSGGPISGPMGVVPPRPAQQSSWIHRRWVPWLAGAIAFLLTVGIGALVVADWAWRSVEMRELLNRVEASEAVMGALQDAADVAFEEHGSGDDQASLDAELRNLAAAAEVDLAAAGDSVSRLPIAVWHTDIERARDAYVLHNRAWQEYMARSSQSASEFVAPQPLVNETFIDAEAPFVDAVPVPDAFGLLERVALIFAMPEGSSSGEQVLALAP